MIQGFQHQRAAAPIGVMKLDPEGADAVARPILVVNAQPCPNWADLEVSPCRVPPMCWNETFAIGNPHRHGLFAEITNKIRKPDQASRHLKVREFFHSHRRNASVSITSQRLLNCAMSAAEEISPDARATASRLLSTALQVVAARAVDGVRRVNRRSPASCSGFGKCVPQFIGERASSVHTIANRLLGTMKMRRPLSFAESRSRYPANARSLR